MKHIIIEGNESAGKSETVNAICKKLNPSKIYEIDIRNATSRVYPPGQDLINGTYVIEVNGKSILVVAGAPKEQVMTISAIIKVVIKLNFDISFAIVAKRTYEGVRKYHTIRELDAISTCLGIEHIAFIEGTDESTIRTDPKFLKRVEKLYNIVIQHL